MDPFVGEIRLFAGTFAPRDWAICDGSLIQLDDAPELFQLYGTTFGGDGTNTFGVPDLRGRLPIGTGQAVTGSTYVQGQMGGDENVTLQTSQLPKHNHTLNLTTAAAVTAIPGPGVVPATTDPLLAPYSHLADATGTYASYSAASLDPAGGYAAHSNLMPSVGINFIVSLQGIFPSQ